METIRKKELLHYKVGHPNPAFISVSGLNEAVKGDWLFTYDNNMICRGAYPYEIDPSFDVAYGEDATEEGIQGFNHLEPVNVGLYDASEDKFYELITDKTIKYMSLGMNVVKATKGKEIILDIQPNLAQTFVKVNLAETFKVEGKGTYYIYFDITGKNIENVTVSFTGNSSEPRKTYESTANNNYTAKYRYEVAKVDKLFAVNVVATDVFGNGMVSNRAFTQITQYEETTPPTPEEDRLIGENDYVKFVERVKSFGNTIYIVNKTDKEIKYKLSLVKKSGGKVSNGDYNHPLEPNSEKLCVPSSQFKSIYLGILIIDGVATKINQIYIIFNL